MSKEHNYPKEYLKRGAEVIESYFQDDNLEATALLSLAALAIGAVADQNKENWGVSYEEAFEMTKSALVKPDK